MQILLFEPKKHDFILYYKKMLFSWFVRNDIFLRANIKLRFFQFELKSLQALQQHPQILEI